MPPGANMTDQRCAAEVSLVSVSDPLRMQCGAAPLQFGFIPHQHRCVEAREYHTFDAARMR
jgi:hypothetical protein